MLFTATGFSILIANIVFSEGASNTIAMPKQDTVWQQSNPQRPLSRKSVPLSRFKSTTATSAAPLQICSEVSHPKTVKERSEYRFPQAKLARTEENGTKSGDKKDPDCGKAEDAPTKYVFHIIKLSSKRDWTNIRSKKSASKRRKSIAQASEATT